MRTQDEIVNQIEAIKPHDFLGWNIPDYIVYLDYEHAKPYLSETSTPAAWVDTKEEYTDENVRAEIKGYIEFAWNKANNCRGISAARSMEHFRNWFWLLGETALSEMCESEYQYYGKDELVKITQWLDLNPATYDDGRRVNSDQE